MAKLRDLSLHRRILMEKSHLIWRIFQAIEQNDHGHDLWNLLDQITMGGLNEGVVYMTYAGETPQTFAEKFHRGRLSRLIQLHQKLTVLRAQFSS